MLWQVNLVLSIPEKTVVNGADENAIKKNMQRHPWFFLPENSCSAPVWWHTNVVVQSRDMRHKEAAAFRLKTREGILWQRICIEKQSFGNGYELSIPVFVKRRSFWVICCCSTTSAMCWNDQEERDSWDRFSVQQVSTRQTPWRSLAKPGFGFDRNHWLSINTLADLFDLMEPGSNVEKSIIELPFWAWNGSQKPKKMG